MGYGSDLDADWGRKGPMCQVTVKLAERVMAGEAIAGRCWCETRRCHGSLIIDRIKEVIRERNPRHPFLQQG
jgi:hypothetical protein